MGSGNGHLVRLEQVESDHRDLRQLFMDEMRGLRHELKALADTVKHLSEQSRDTGRAVDTLLAELKLRDKEEGLNE